MQRGNLRRCGLTEQDLQGILRQHGMTDPREVGLAVFEAKGAVSILTAARPPEPTNRG